MGYQARLARKNEPSVDVIAHKDHLGIEPPIIKVQVNRGDGTITDKDVSVSSTATNSWTSSSSTTRNSTPCYKSVLPLRRIYVPELIDDTGE